MTSVLITGARGFVARSLAPVLGACGARVVGTSRHDAGNSLFAKVYEVRLGESLRPVLERELPDAVVHCALDGGPDAYSLNVDGTTRWLEESSGCGVRLQILLSTLSATPDALSDYGRAKHCLEQRFSSNGEVSFRLGLVVGDGGMFARLRETSRRYPVIPLLSGGRQLVYVLGIDYLCAVLRDCIVSSGTGLKGRAWNLHTPRAYTLREVIDTINIHCGYRRVMVPIPAVPVLGMLMFLEGLGFRRLPVTSANVRGLMRQGRVEISTDFASFGYPEQDLDTLVAAAVGGTKPGMRSQYL